MDSALAVSEKMLEKYRHINVEHNDWYDYEYECFREDMKAKGIDVVRMYFSGFWSQGDGACFEGGFDDVRLFIESHFKDTDYPMIRKLLDEGGSVVINCNHSGHYYHENCTRFSIGADELQYCMKMPTEFHEQVVESMDKKLSVEVTDFESASIEIFKGYMRDLYRRLENEYDGLTSDEAVAEAIIANDLNEDEGE